MKGGGEHTIQDIQKAVPNYWLFIFLFIAKKSFLLLFRDFFLLVFVRISKKLG
jgi:hypothetical protein